MRKLSIDQVLEVRSRYALGGIRQSDLADEFGLARENMRRVLHGQTYKDIGGPRSCPGRGHNKKLTIEQVAGIRQQISTKSTTLTQLAKEFGMAVSTLSNVVRRKTYNQDCVKEAK